MQSDLGFKNDGTITMLTVQPGDRVKQGQVPAQQDPTNLKLALDQAENTVLQDQISLESAIINRDSKEKILKQQERLFQAGVSSEMELDTARNNYRKSELELKTAQVRLENDQAKVELARSYLNDATLVAPFDGIVGTVNGQVGQINGINASSSILLTVMSEDLQLNALVNEADIGRVRIGQEVEFTSNTYPDEVFQGKVLRITPEAQTVSSVQYYPVLISCVDPERKLYPGMSVSAKIIVARESDILTIPMMAVSFAENYLRSHPEASQAKQASKTGTQTRPGNISADKLKDGQAGIVLVLQNGQPEIRNVVLGLNNGSVYKVVDGLEPGERVVIGSNHLDTSSFASGENNRRTNVNQGPPIQRGGVMVMPRRPLN